MVGSRGRVPPGPALVMAVSAAALAGCGDGPGTVDRVTIRDSAGVEIVESRTPAWEEGEGWRVDPEPLVRIGVVEGDPAYQFSGLTGAVRLADGTLVAADGNSCEVRFFDPRGSFLRAFGGPGGGPGEFEVLGAVGLGSGDEIWAWDFNLRRLTWLSSSGELLRTVPLGPEPAFLFPVGPLAGGTFVLRQLWAATATAQSTRTGLRRDPVAYVRFDSTGALVDTLGLFPGRELFIGAESGRSVMTFTPFGRVSVAAVRNGRIVVGSQGRFELEEYRPDGSLARIVRLPDGDLTVSQREVEALIETRVEAAPPESREDFRRTLEALPHPESRPAHGALLSDSRDHHWVADWSPAGRLPRRWTVLDARGRWLGPVTLPEGFYPYQIGPDWILGRETDELDVEYLALYRLIRSPLSS